MARFPFLFQDDYIDGFDYNREERGNVRIDNSLGEYNRNIYSAAHPDESHLTHFQPGPQLYFNSVAFILPKLLSHLNTTEQLFKLNTFLDAYGEQITYVLVA